MLHFFAAYIAADATTDATGTNILATPTSSALPRLAVMLARAALARSFKTFSFSKIPSSEHNLPYITQIAPKQLAIVAGTARPGKIPPTASAPAAASAQFIIIFPYHTH